MTLVTCQKTRLLLIDDDPSMVRLLTTVLKREFDDDVEIVALEHSQAALQWIEYHVVDILITDLEMPQINGLDLLKAAKRRNACTQVFFMTVTGRLKSGQPGAPPKRSHDKHNSFSQVPYALMLRDLGK